MGVKGFQLEKICIFRKKTFALCHQDVSFSRDVCFCFWEALKRKETGDKTETEMSVTGSALTHP